MSRESSFEGTRRRSGHRALPSLQLLNGRVLARDAGPITFTLTFGANGNLISIVSSDESGPHPIIDSGSFGCDVLVPALT